MDQAQFEASIAKMRQGLRDGGDVVMPDGTSIALQGPTALIIAQMVYEHDRLQWDRGGRHGPEPSLSQLLHQSRIGGRHLSESEWLAQLSRYPGLDDMREQVLQQLVEEDARHSRPRLMPADLVPHHKFAPRDVVRVRAEIAAWLRQPGEDGGVAYYRRAIEAGKQGIFLPDTNTSRQEALAHTEADAIRAADLYFIDADMCQLLTAAYPSMPEFAPMPGDLPSEYGFAIFELPISHHFNRPLTDAALTVGLLSPDGGFTDISTPTREEGTQIMAVSWRPHIQYPGSHTWRAGGVWMTFYAKHMAKVMAERGGPDAPVWQLMAKDLPTLAPENECILSWYVADGSDDRDDHMLGPRMGTGEWGRAVLAAFQLARQSNLAQTDIENVAGRPLPKAKVKRTGAKTSPAGQVRVVRLRAQLRAARDAQQQADGQMGKTREYRHRWVVRGFWRQTWYPSAGVNRPQWIAPYLKGPQGAPLLGGEKVTLVSPPKGAKTVPPGT